MKRNTKTPKPAATPVAASAPAAPAKLAPCDVTTLISHYRHQLHNHLVDRGDNEAIALLFTITTLETIRADQEVTA